MNKKAIYSILSTIVAMVVLSVSLVFAIGPRVSADSETIGYLDQREFFEIDEAGVLLGLTQSGCDYADQYDKLEVVFPEGMVTTSDWSFGLQLIDQESRGIFHYHPARGGLMEMAVAPHFGDWDIRDKIVSLTLPNSLEKIGNGAFEFLHNLKTVNLGNSLIKIGAWAFAGTNLSEVTIPASVAVVDECVFFDCLNLTQINCEATTKPDGWKDTWIGPNRVYDEEQGEWVAREIPVEWNYNNGVSEAPETVNPEPTEPATPVDKQSTTNNPNNIGLIAGIAGTSAGVMLIVGIVLGIVIAKHRRK